MPATDEEHVIIRRWDELATPHENVQSRSGCVDMVVGGRTVQLVVHSDGRILLRAWSDDFPTNYPSADKSVEGYSHSGRQVLTLSADLPEESGAPAKIKRLETYERQEQ